MKVSVSEGVSTSPGNPFDSPKLVPTRRSVGNKIIHKRWFMFVFRIKQFVLNVNYVDLAVILEFFFKCYNRMDDCHML